MNPPNEHCAKAVLVYFVLCVFIACAELLQTVSFKFRP